MRLIVTRPEVDARPLRTRLEALGHQVTLLPLLRIVPRGGVAIPDRHWQAIVATSANGVRAASGLGSLKSHRMLTLGPQSLQAAREAGYGNSDAQGGDVKGLARYIGQSFHPKDGPLLYLSGAETTGDLQGQLRAMGFDVVRTVLYDAVAVEDIAGLALQAHDGVLLYSPRSARIWSRLVGVTCFLHHYCLSPNVAAALPAHWRISISKTPDEASMLALLDPHP